MCSIITLASKDSMTLEIKCKEVEQEHKKKLKKEGSWKYL
jgi:hypothetical protein